MKTALKFIKKNCDTTDGLLNPFDVAEAMIEFAKMHVEAALKEASENAESYVIGGLTSEVDKESILNAYPLTNIK